MGAWFVGKQVFETDMENVGSSAGDFNPTREKQDQPKWLGGLGSTNPEHFGALNVTEFKVFQNLISLF